MEPVYRGRFAPSPTGPLHFGSLFAALASYLHARRLGGKWVVRIEDLDPPREIPGAATLILKQLERHGLEWDDDVLYQSQRHRRYDEVLQHLLRDNSAYFCRCSRKDLLAMGGYYDGRCRERRNFGPIGTAVRIHVPESDQVIYEDIFQGYQCNYPGRENGDYVIHRRDGLYAYQLAVVVDDMDQGITHVIRGMDLKESTPRQIWLYQRLGARVPLFGHIPVVVNKFGQKLSKQNHAASLDELPPLTNLRAAIDCLGVPPLSDACEPHELIEHALAHWRPENLHGIESLPAPIEYQ